jgi:uncharacterized protein (DUF1330 family)
MYIHPTKQQVNAFTSLPPNDPVVLLNLARIRVVAEYDAAGMVPTNVRTGRDAFLLYSEEAKPLLLQYGATVSWISQSRRVVIGPSSEQWDLAFVTHYRSAREALALIFDPRYRAAARHRAAALHDSRLIVCSPLTTAGSFAPKEWLSGLTDEQHAH